MLTVDKCSEPVDGAYEGYLCHQYECPVAENATQLRKKPTWNEQDASASSVHTYLEPVVHTYLEPVVHTYLELVVHTYFDPYTDSKGGSG